MAKIKVDLHDIYNDNKLILKSLNNALDQAEEKTLN